jgi:hypothetical protein
MDSSLKYQANESNEVKPNASIVSIPREESHPDVSSSSHDSLKVWDVRPTELSFQPDPLPELT